MAKQVLEARIRQKTDTLANWNANTLVLLGGEPAYILNEDGTPVNFKLGDGTKTFAELPNWIAYDQAAYKKVTSNALPASDGGIHYSLVFEGTYTQTTGGNVVIPTDSLGIISNNGTSWSIDDVIALPRGEDGSALLSLWEYKSSGYVKDSQVRLENGDIYVNNIEGNKTSPEGIVAVYNPNVTTGSELSASVCEFDINLAPNTPFEIGISGTTGLIDRIQFFETRTGQTSRQEFASYTPPNIDGVKAFNRSNGIDKLTVRSAAANVIGTGTFNVYYRVPSINTGWIKISKDAVNSLGQSVRLPPTQKVVTDNFEATNESINTLSQQQTELSDNIETVRSEVEDILLGDRTTNVVAGSAYGPGTAEFTVDIKQGEQYTITFKDLTYSLNEVRFNVIYTGQSTRTMIDRIIGDTNVSKTYTALQDIQTIGTFSPAANVIKNGQVSVTYVKHKGLNAKVNNLEIQLRTRNDNSSPNVELSANTHTTNKGTAVNSSNNQQNQILSDNLRPVSVVPNTRNIKISDVKIGDNGTYHTSNIIFDDANVVYDRWINPTLEKKENKNLTVIELPDGTRTRFTLPNYLNNSADIIVFLNGSRLSKDVDYIAYPTKKCIVFTVAPSTGSKIILDYDTYTDEFVSMFSFNNLRFNGTKTRLLGIDTGYLYNNSADLFFNEKNNLEIFYEVNDLSKANADLVADPLNASNSCLKFSLIDANILDTNPQKGRVQLQVQGVRSSELNNTVDIFLPTSMQYLEQNPDVINWLTIQEIWCSVAGTQIAGKPQFRMTVALLKRSGIGQKLYFSVKVEDLNYVNGNPVFTELYELTNEVFTIPYNTWFTLNTIVVSGDQNNGYLKMTAKVGSAATVTLFDQNCQTQATGYSDLTTQEAVYDRVDILKLYTSKALIDFMKNSGRQINIFFKNWIYRGKCRVIK